MKSIVPTFASLRFNFLTLTPVCVFLAAALSFRLTGHLHASDVALVLLGALFAHASVNLLNEYQDFASGLDAITVKTPFSGGSGALPAHPEAAGAVLAAALLTFAGTAAIGLYFLRVHGLMLLPVGLLGLVVIVFYTKWITHHPVLCLVAPGLGFGPLMVMGSSFVLTGHYSWEALLASLTPFFLVSELLLINQFPDVEPDRQVGRRHLPIAIGRRQSARVFACFLFLAYVPIILGIALRMFPPMTALGLIPLLGAVPLAKQVLRNAERPAANLVPYLGLNVALIMGTILLFSIGWCFPR